jgi:hypothetical protein
MTQSTSSSMVSDKEGEKNVNTYLRGVKWVGDVAS